MTMSTSMSTPRANDAHPDANKKLTTNNNPMMCADPMCRMKYPEIQRLSFKELEMYRVHRVDFPPNTSKEYYCNKKCYEAHTELLDVNMEERKRYAHQCWFRSLSVKKRRRFLEDLQKELDQPVNNLR
jgi:hypothetical protein